MTKMNCPIWVRPPVKEWVLTGVTITKGIRYEKSSSFFCFHLSFDRCSVWKKSCGSHLITEQDAERILFSGLFGKCSVFKRCFTQQSRYARQNKIRRKDCVLSAGSSLCHHGPSRRAAAFLSFIFPFLFPISAIR